MNVTTLENDDLNETFNTMLSDANKWTKGPGLLVDLELLCIMRCLQKVFRC